MVQVQKSESESQSEKAGKYRSGRNQLSLDLKLENFCKRIIRLQKFSSFRLFRLYVTMIVH